MHNDSTAKILALLAEHEQLSRVEIQKELELTKRSASALLSKLLKPTPRQSKRIYVIAYTFDDEGARAYPRPLYALGDRPDARRPDMRLERRREYRRVEGQRVASVWDLALPSSHRARKFQGIGCLT